MHAPVPVLRAMRVIQARFSRVRPGAGAADLEPAPDSAGTAPFVLCLVLEGGCVAIGHGDEATLLGRGDFGVFPRGLRRLDAEADNGHADVLRADLACDDWLVRTLFACLPRQVVLPSRTIDASGWLEASLRHGVAQSDVRCAGRAAARSRLAEALLAEVLPLCMPQRGEVAPGWLEGAGDRLVGQALAAMQRSPDRDWTLDALAREANTSRSVLSERFQQRMGTPPMQYLAQLRLALAASLLATSEVPLIRIAEDVGYQTDTAFSRAFRRQYGVPPAAWRRRHAAASGRMDSFPG
ncbi:MAG: AraC family transcriptional regulator [Pseudomonadota bacterium]|nr:AraC family transcriptional regulator [Pseudomonadota bacterium]